MERIVLSHCDMLRSGIVVLASYRVMRPGQADVVEGQPAGVHDVDALYFSILAFSSFLHTSLFVSNL